MKAWDSEYALRGRLWGGRLRGLPTLPEGTSVLELGCGDGNTICAMPRGWKTTALDTSLSALHLCNRSIPNLDLILADATKLPFRTESFEAIFAYHIAGHLFKEGRMALAREATRVLIPGGRLFFREFGREDMRMGEGQIVEEATFLRGTGITTHYFTEIEAEELFYPLRPISIHTQHWKMRVRGMDLNRSQVEAAFEKADFPSISEFQNKKI